MSPRPELDAVCQVVVAAAREELPRGVGADGRRKADGSVVTEADFTMQQRLIDELRQRWPEFSLLGEEMSSGEQRRLLRGAEQGLWVLDPLDGTSNYAAGIPLYSVSLALVRPERTELAVVYDPERDECFAAAPGAGASVNGNAIPKLTGPRRLAQSIAIIDYKRLPTKLAVHAAQNPPYRSQRNFGSVALEWCWLALGRGHLYLHGRQKLWDYAAGALIFREAGGVASTIEGDAGFAPRIEPRSAIAAANPELFEAWSQWLQIPTGR